MLSVVTFAMLATAGRPPTVDLPQHAVTLRRFLDGPSDIFAIRWSAPYSVFFFVASLFAMVVDAARAVWLTMALTIALMPVAGAALAASLRRTPLLGCFALLGAFTTVTGWGFLPLMLGAVVATFVFAAALHHADQPGTRPAVLLAVLLAMVYSAHLVAWVIAVPLSIAVVVTRPRPLSFRALWPLVVGRRLLRDGERPDGRRRNERAPLDTQTRGTPVAAIDSTRRVRASQRRARGRGTSVPTRSSGLTLEIRVC